MQEVIAGTTERTGSKTTSQMGGKQDRGWKRLSHGEGKCRSARWRRPTLGVASQMWEGRIQKAAAANEVHGAEAAVFTDGSRGENDVKPRSRQSFDRGANIWRMERQSGTGGQRTWQRH